MKKKKKKNYLLFLDSLLQMVFVQLLNTKRWASHSSEISSTTSPLATYTTGNDFIQIKGDDTHYYFFCGVPGHCKNGQKVDIQVSTSLGQATKSRSSCYSNPCTSAPSTPTPSFPRTPSSQTPFYRPPPSSMIYSPATFTSSTSKFLSSSLFVGLAGATLSCFDALGSQL
ncbi:hypothetical protein MKW92_043805 [Papaver armeniacum]|nr:hypothetical protein MKW92_043805 [Papaver armeniacum]